YWLLAVGKIRVGRTFPSDEFPLPSAEPTPAKKVEVLRSRFRERNFRTHTALPTTDDGSSIIPAMNLEEKIQELKRRDQLADEGGGKERRERQHKEGKMSARERIEFLLDEGTFEETDRFVTHRANDFGLSEQKYYGDGFITGYGRIEGRLVFV